MATSTTRKSWASRIGSMVFGLLMALLMLEIGMRIGFDALPAWVRGAIQNVRTVPWNDETIVPPPPMQEDTDYQHILQPGLDDHEMFFADGSFHLSTISLWNGRVGIRSPEPVWPVDVIAIGDSFTVCFTEIEDCWVDHLRQDQGWSVMNLGQIATGSLSHLQILQTFGVPLDPQVVIWQWYGNDFNEDYGLARLRGDTPELDSPATATDEQPDLGWLAEYSAVYATLRQWWYDRDHEGADDGIEITVEGHLMQLGDSYTINSTLMSPANQYGWERTVAALDTADQVVHEQIGGEWVIVLIPAKDEVYADYLADDVDPAYIEDISRGRQQMLDLCAERGWHCIDPLDVLQAEARAGQMVYYRLDSHLNPHGNEILARLIADYLIEHHLISD